MIDEAIVQTFFIGRERLDQFVQQQEAIVTRMCHDGLTDFRPKLVVLFREPEEGSPEQIGLFGLEIDMNDPQQKSAALRTAGEALYQQQVVPVAAAVVTECWIATYEPALAHLRPSQRSDRSEAIVVMAVAMGAIACNAFCLFTRGEGNRIVLGEWSHDSGEGTAVSPLLAHFFQAYIEAAARSANLERN